MLESMTKFGGGGKIPAARLRVGIALSNGGKIPAMRFCDEVRGGEIPANF